MDAVTSGAFDLSNFAMQTSSGSFQLVEGELGERRFDLVSRQKL